MVTLPYGYRLHKGKAKADLPKVGKGVDMRGADLTGFRLSVNEEYASYEPRFLETYQHHYPHDPSKDQYPDNIVIVTPYEEACRNFWVTYDRYNGANKLIQRTDGTHLLRYDRSVPERWVKEEQYGKWIVTDQPDPDIALRKTLDDLFRQKQELEAKGDYRSTKYKALEERIKNGQRHIKLNCGVRVGRLTFVMPAFVMDADLGVAALTLGSLVTHSGSDIETLSSWMERGEALARAAGESMYGKGWKLFRHNKKLQTPLNGERSFSVIGIEPLDASWMVRGQLAAISEPLLLEMGKTNLLSAGLEAEHVIDVEFEEVPM